MSKQWGHGFNTGMAEGHDLGEGAGRGLAEWKIANEMRVLFCALITAHKRHDGLAFYATIEIVKTVLSKYANFDEEDWAVFRRDVARKEETPNALAQGREPHRG